MSPITELIVQILWFALAAWFLLGAYKANKKAEPLSLRNLLPKQNSTDSRRHVFFAVTFLLGAVLIFLLGYKLFTCGLVCWS
jgi:hypothetical protein